MQPDEPKTAPTTSAITMVRAILVIAHVLSTRMQEYGAGRSRLLQDARPHAQGLSAGGGAGGVTGADGLSEGGGTAASSLTTGTFEEGGAVIRVAEGVLCGGPPEYVPGIIE
jgi:hypothetical protein